MTIEEFRFIVLPKKNSTRRSPPIDNTLHVRHNVAIPEKLQCTETNKRQFEQSKAKDILL